MNPRQLTPASSAGRSGSRWSPKAHIGAVAVLAGLLLASAAPAYAATSHAAKKAAALTKITIAYTAPVADQALLPTTQAAGLFKKNGLQVTVEFLSPALATEALVAGEVQYVEVGAPSAEVAAINGTPLEYVGSWEHFLDAEIVANKSISTPQELNGKTIAISSSGALSDLLVQIAEHDYNITMHEVPLGAFQNETGAYVHGTVDAISGTNIWQMPALESDLPGSHIVVDFRKDLGYPGAGGLIADANWAKSKANGATTVKVLKALYQGLKYFKTHQSVAVTQIATMTSEPTSEATQAYDVVKAAFSNSVAPVLSDQKNVLTALSWTDSAASSFNAASLMNATYAKAAMK